jgi:hypothetical protein
MCIFYSIADTALPAAAAAPFSATDFFLEHRSYTEELPDEVSSEYEEKKEL